jgi:hypothetical protein
MTGRLMPPQVTRAVRVVKRWSGAAIASPASPRGLRSVLMASAFSGVLLSGMLVWTSSESAFGGNAQNPASSWTAGTVAINDDDGAAVLFNSSGLVPGDTGTKCITVNYTGSLTANVKVFVSSLTGTLGPYLNMTLEQGNGGSFADCSGFVAETSVSATLSGLGTTYGTGFGTWAPTGTGQSRTYRISWSLALDNNGANKTATATFTFQGQST